MEQKQKDALWAQYSKQTHVLGRVLSILTVALLLGAPFVIGGLLGARHIDGLPEVHQSTIQPG